MPGEEISLFVAVPLWVSVYAGGPAPLLEVPALRLRQTWHGPSTVSGTLCWAAPAPARLREEALPSGAHLAHVEVRLVNRASTSLLVDRVTLPMVHLPLWWYPERGLLASDLLVERNADGETASLRLADAPPTAGATFVVAARQPGPRLGLVRAMEALLG
jgi:hypothetical protein